MQIPRFALGLLAGGLIAVVAPRLVATAHAQDKPLSAPAPAWTPPIRYQYHVLNVGWNSALAAETIFNGLGQDGWHVVGQAGAYVTFERSWATR